MRFGASTTVAAPDVPRGRARIILVLLLSVAASLRIYHLDTESLWLDEGFSISVVRTTLDNILHETSLDFHPPLYFVLLYGWTMLAGSGDFAARLLSVLFSLGSLGAAYAISARLFDRRTALFACTLLTVSTFQIEFAQEARMYALLALLSTLSMHAFTALVARPATGNRLAFIGATTAVVYTHVYGLFVVAAQGIVLLAIWMRTGLTAQPQIRAWLVGVLVVVVLFGPWIYVMTEQMWRVQGGFWIPPLPWTSIAEPFIAYAGSTPLYVVLLAAAIVGAVLARQPMNTTLGTPATRVPLVLWLLCPILLPFIASRLGSPIFLPKYTIAAAVPFAILAARGLVALRWSWLRLPALALVVAMSSPPLHAYFNTPRKDGWRDATAYLEARAAPGDLVLFHQYFAQVVFDCYRTRADLVEAAFPLPDVYATRAEVPRAVLQGVGRRNRVWLVMLEGEPAKPWILEEMQRDFDLLDYATRQHVDVMLFERHRR